MMKKQNFICGADKIRKAITNIKRWQSNFQKATTVLYFKKI